MTTTYSLAIKGALADNEALTKVTTLPDDSALPGSMALAMQNGTQLLCKNQDGSQSWYTLDAERSTPTVPVLKKVS